MEHNSSKVRKPRFSREAITKDSSALSNYLMNRCTKAERLLMIERIVINCMVSRAVVYNWIHGHSRIPELHKREIEKVIGERLFFIEESA